jgi:hypothetical protein
MDADSSDKKLCRIGGAAVLLTVVCYIVEFFTFFGMPMNTLEWFALFQRSRFLGLFYLNALDIFSISLLCPMFLALHRVLKRKDSAWMTAATSFALLGIAVFVTTRSILTSATITLSQRFASAASEAERGSIIIAGQAIDALGQATPQTVGFFFMAVAVSIASIVMLRSGNFGRVHAIAGILAGAFTFVDDASIIAVPSLSVPCLAVSGLFWIAWWVMTGIKLLMLGGRGTAGEKAWTDPQSD